MAFDRIKDSDIYYNKVISNQVSYPMDISSRPDKSDVYKRLENLPPSKDLTSQYNALGIDVPKKDSDYPLSDMAEYRASQNQREVQTPHLTKVAMSPILSSLKAGLTTGALGAGLGYATGHFLPHLAMDKYPTLKKVLPVVENVIGKNETQFIIDNFKNKAAERLAAVGGTLGGVAGYMGGKIAINHQQKYNDPYYNLYNQMPYKLASGSEHFLIADTGISLMPQTPYPKDVEHAISMEHPYLKYLPLLGFLGGAGASGATDLLKRESVSLGKLGVIGGLGSMALNAVKDKIEKKYAEPYMKNFVKDVDAKYKKANETTEYISDTGYDLLPHSSGPKDLESAIVYKHPYLQALPFISMAAGAGLGNSIAGGKGQVLGGLIGAAAGGVTRIGLLDHYLKDYKDKYIKEVKNKYNV